jgi:capsular exopolysaccharide synthesis family protein
MSHIFDALQKSEAARSGIEVDTLAELLQIADPAAALQPETQEAPPMVPQMLAQLEAPQPQQQAAQESKAVTTPAGPFDQFESLPVTLLPDSKLVSLTQKDSLAAEKFRFLGVRLRQLQQTRLLKKVLITSTIPEEGKSMISANLACTLARRKQQKTLLIEGDLRRPTLSRQFGLGTISGVCECLQGSADLMMSVYRLDALGLWFLPAGSTPQNALELMQSGKLAPIMEQLSSWFDWIVIDSPPILPLADTSVWARLADGILLVTRQGTTQKPQLQRGLEALEPAKLLGAIVNGASSVAHSDYYYQRYAPSALRGNDAPQK